MTVLDSTPKELAGGVFLPGYEDGVVSALCEGEGEFTLQSLPQGNMHIAISSCCNFLQSGTPRRALKWPCKNLLMRVESEQICVFLELLGYQ